MIGSFYGPVVLGCYTMEAYGLAVGYLFSRHWASNKLLLASV